MRHSNLYRRKDSPYWWAWIYDSAGRRIPFSTRKTDQRAAEAVVKQRERSSAAPGLPALRLEDALQALIDKGCDGRAGKTVEMYASRGGVLLRLFGEDRDVNCLELHDVRSYIATRRAEWSDPAKTRHPAPSTIAKELITLRRALKLARESGAYRRDPAAIFPSDFRPHYEPRERWLTTDEYLRLQAHLPLERQVWVALAVFGSCRAGEVRRTCWEHVDFEESRLRVPGRKTKKAKRGIPLAAELRAILLPLRRSSGTVTDSWGNVGRDLKAACRAARIHPVTPNDLRRTYGSWLAQRGVSLKAIADLMGHTTTAMVDRVYGHLADENYQRAVAVLPRFTPEQRSSYVTDPSDQTEKADSMDEPASEGKPLTA